MRVTKAQAQANRAHIVETAATLFRERGYDGVGVADLMAAAGFTHGGFYKHFGGKADLMAEAAASGLAQTLAMTHGADLEAFARQYLSRQHRDAPGSGCTLAALSGDAARQEQPVRAIFAEGLERVLAALKQEGAGTESDTLRAEADAVESSPGGESGHAGKTAEPRAAAGSSTGEDAGATVCAQALRARNINAIAHAVGALVLSRACPDDSPLADEILDTCRAAILADAQAGPQP